MQNLKPIRAVAGLLTIWFVSFGVAAEQAEPLERGKDRIDVPAMGSGLFLHNVFQSGMVIQRDKPIRVWGWADEDEKVVVTFGEQTQTATAAKDGPWQVEFPAQSANSAPCRLVVQGGNKKIELENILVGDVWVLGGQSNMEFEIAKVDGGQLEIVSANFPNIRLFTAAQLNGSEYRKTFPLMYQWSDWSGRHYRQGYWDVCTPETVRDMSAIGYVFARRLHMATQVPIGIIDVSRGGTTLETWTPLKVLESIDTPEVSAQLTEWNKKVAEFDPKQDLESRVRSFHERAARLKAQGQAMPADAVPPSDLLPGPAMDQNRPGNCYASMIAPLAGLQVKGVIWHQGFNNALQPNGHALYYQVFPKMIAAWRQAFDNAQLPFGIISLCTADEPQGREDYLRKMLDEGIYIREVHYRTFVDLFNSGDKQIGYASSFDQRRSWYHPQIKIPVGERIARWALATQYGMSNQIRWRPPMLVQVKVEAGQLVLQFDSDVGPYHDGPMEGFAIAGEDGRFQPAKAEWLTVVKGNQNKPQPDRRSIVLTSPLVPKPIYFRHAWGRNPLANLKSTDHTDLPVPTLRNDTFTIADLYEVYTGKKPVTANVLDGRERGELNRAVEAEDLKRRVAEAKELLKVSGM